MTGPFATKIVFREKQYLFHTLNSDFRHALYLDSMLSFLLFSRLLPPLQKEDFVRIIISKIESLTPEH